jgi:hypothetical protein
MTSSTTRTSAGSISARSSGCEGEAYCLSMIFSENRRPLFGIMLYDPVGLPSVLKRAFCSSVRLP